MPTTRHQAAIEKGRREFTPPRERVSEKVAATQKNSTNPKKRGTEEAEIDSKPQSKLTRAAPDNGEQQEVSSPRKQRHVYQTGTIERGHIYFFYRPKVETEEVQSDNEVKNFHMLLVPGPPAFAVSNEESSSSSKADPTRTEEAEMKALAPGADAIPAPVTRQTSNQHYRLVTIGKKKLPDPKRSRGAGKQKETFWATITSVGEDLHDLVDGLSSKTYETKTRGTRHEGAARLVARGGYAIVNTDAKMPSQRETHLGYNVSHPSPEDMADVQASLGIYSSSSFVVQVKNSKAPNTAAGTGHAKEPEYPAWMMSDIFGAARGGASRSKGRQPYGLKFASVETPELLDHVGAQLILIAARDGEQGLETSLGEGRGEALSESVHKEASVGIMDVFNEIGLTQDFTKYPLQGRWA